MPCLLLLMVSLLSQPVPKKTPAKKKAAVGSSSSKQGQLNFQPAVRSSRAAATKARGRMVVSFLWIFIQIEQES